MRLKNACIMSALLRKPGSGALLGSTPSQAGRVLSRVFEAQSCQAEARRGKGASREPQTVNGELQEDERAADACSLHCRFAHRRRPAGLRVLRLDILAYSTQCSHLPLHATQWRVQVASFASYSFFLHLPVVFAKREGAWRALLARRTHFCLQDLGSVLSRLGRLTHKTRSELASDCRCMLNS